MGTGRESAAAADFINEVLAILGGGELGFASGLTLSYKAVGWEGRLG